ncbi:bifunctional phosphopantothenoylcysteine decarboxylase/phosphopantothenate--cysteine ligase CoaBC [Crocinitomicaceae bacterium]|jgi:phosphopantothenoylcysteine decarboxylase/phosphopantothenate--cysteine ligase|nr:bifunctional phosphopantothenoylcysteine decarboxylase/phosphopantothenate--cysteine ligase CoaBC [Crocinitomicaceae bacterium]MDG1035697.1 bifunctional phosphopantothenoylcysteine decarboxylase/phosphopantothenate--cysteine ligase CoaBC [Crocinitomicaceae bacterium]
MRGKRILLGITGGIAAYKIAFLIRLLKKSGAEVKCIMTPASSDFISPVVVSTLSENPVGIEFWDKNDGTWNNHVEYGLWADLFIIAPLTANTLSKMANGSCDNLLLATYLSMRAKTLVAPAMDLDMYAHATTQRNLKQLENDGVHVIPAESGALASGLEGEGRMAEPEIILASIEYHLNRAFEAILDRRSVLITAGPTFEALDPVRFIGNHSSGKMGYRIADELSSMGAEVILISGPTQQKVRNRDIEVIQVSTADQMFKEVQKLWPMSDFGIFSAAVADYKPKEQEIKKIKKNKEELSIDLVRNPDILKWAGDHKSNQQTLVGFALETNDLLENGRKKLISKNLDFIVLNTLQDKGAGFGVDTNKISILDSHNNLEEFELKPKAEVAKDIVSYLKTYLEK